MKRFWLWLISKFRKRKNIDADSPKPESESKSEVGSKPEVEPKPVEPVPHPKFRIDNLDELDEWDRERLVRANEILNYILRDPSTKERWLSYQSVENNGLSQAEIWDLWVRGDQLSEEDEIGVTDVKIIMYHNRFSRVVGYTYLESLFIWINRKFFSTDVSRASNLGHEALGHQYGFTHTVKEYWKTVPWLVNRLVEEQYEALQLDKKFPPL